MERAEAYRGHIERALCQPGLDDKPISFHRAGEKLNELQIPSPMGGRWSSMNVADIAVRLKLREKPIRVSHKILQKRVEAIWKAHPDCTGQQVVEMLKPQHPICIARAWAFLRTCREVAAKRSPAQQQAAWPVDRHTAARIRISTIWKRHPEFTGKQVIEKLGSKHSGGIPWVQKILRESWRASVRPNPKRQVIGRRIYGAWR
jgi:ribosomal protein L31